MVDEVAAIRDGAVQLHDNVPQNITTLYKVSGGNYAAAASEADHLVRLRIVNNRLIPTCMETRVVVAEPNADETLTVYLPSQVPHMHRRWIAEATGIAENRLRIVAPDIGGGFGAKMHLYPEELLCPYAARALGQPVKWRETRSESHLSTSHGRAHTETIEAAVRNDGTILGMKVETLGNVGAYLSNMASGGPTVNTINFGTGNYRIMNYEAIARVVVTNTVPVDAYRGYGRPEGAYIAERTIDAVARHLKLDPAASAAPTSSGRRSFHSARTTAKASSTTAATMKACSKRRSPRSTTKTAAASVTNCAAPAGIAASGSLPIRTCAAWHPRAGWRSPASTAVAGRARASPSNSSGRVTIYSGSMSQGHGHATSLAQIAADVLQIPIENIDVVQGDTRQVQAGHGTFNSRSMAVGGSGLHIASQRIVAKAKKIAAGMLEVDETDVIV